jgi:hypothetical protein
MAVAMSIVANLLVKGEYDVVEAVTRGRRLTANRLRHLMKADGRGFILAPISAYEELYGEQTGEEPATFHIWFPLWTAEGPSDLVLELDLIEDIPDTVGTEITDLRVRTDYDDLSGLTVLARPDLRGPSDSPDDLFRRDRARRPIHDDRGPDRILTDEEREVVVRVVRALVDRDHDYLRTIGAYVPPGADPYLWTRDYGRWDQVDLVVPPGNPNTWEYDVFRGSDPEWISVDVEMWTEQEGRSDLTLQLDLRRMPEGPLMPLFRSLHVL